MRIFFLSDVHQEFGQLDFSTLQATKGDVILLLGDIGIGKEPVTYKPLVASLAARGCTVVYIPGNHEFYHGSMAHTVAKIGEQLYGDESTNKGYNIFFGESLSLVLNEHNIAIACATLWTNFGRNPHYELVAQQSINDFRLINGANTTLMTSKFNYQKQFLLNFCKEQKKLGRKVIIGTHFGCSALCVHPKYKGDVALNSYYVTSLDNELLLLGDEGIAPDYWLHGHTHHVFDVTVGKTRIMTNPRGYVGYEHVEGYDINKFIEV